MASKNLQARQILVDVTPNEMGHSPYKDIANTTIAAKANNALKSIPEAGSYRVVGVNKMTNGGLLMEMNNEEAAQWIRSKEIQSVFVK